MRGITVEHGLMLTNSMQVADCMPARHLKQADVARRWQLSPRTLEAWRWHGFGPAYCKIGGRVVYRLEDILAYEAAQRQGGC